MHRVEEVFALGVDAHAEAVARGAEAFLQLRDRLPGTRGFGDEHHRELAAHDRR